MKTQSSCLPYSYLKIRIHLIFGCTWSSWLCMGFLWLWWVGLTLHCRARPFRCSSFSRCWAQALVSKASVVVACGLGNRGTRSVAPWRVESFWTRDQTHVPCISDWILNQILPLTREVLPYSYNSIRHHLLVQ